jgi:hypothetical protein
MFRNLDLRISKLDGMPKESIKELSKEDLLRKKKGQRNRLIF